MALSHPVKLVLKSTTTQTLSDRFTEMMRNKSVGNGNNRQRVREENITQTRASAKNRRLAEQMSHRRDAVMDQFDNEVDIKSRLDTSKIKTNVKERLGRTPNFNGNGNVQNRLGASRSRGRGRGNISRPYQTSRSPGFQSSRSRGGSRATLRGSSRGSFQQRGRFQPRGRGTRGLSRGSPRSRARGRGRGRGGRGGNKGYVDRSDLDTELDSYMSNSL